MPLTLNRPWFVFALLVQALCAPAQGADSDRDALELESEPDLEPSSAATKAFVEAGLGWAEQRYGLGSRSISRLTLDGRHAARLLPSTQAVASARIDRSNPPDTRIDGAVFSLREAYLGWQDDDAAAVLEAGRINLRDSPGYAYNPTDFFRDNALRTYATVDPASLRDNRMGSVMLRAQHLLPGGSLAAVYSPELDDSPSDSSFSLDLGSTNARDRGQLSWGHRLSEKVNAELLLYKEAGSSVRFGASFSALVSDAVVVYAEGTHSSEPDLLSRALMLPAPSQSGNRLNAGLSYTTTTRLSLTAEYQYNGFALDRTGWETLQVAGPDAQGAYYSQALALQDNAGQQTIFLHAVQRDLAIKNLDLTALLKLNRTDNSRMFWLDLRYRLQKFDISLRVQRNVGDEGSEFGIVPISTSAGAVVTAYF